MHKVINQFFIDSHVVTDGVSTLNPDTFADILIGTTMQNQHIRRFSKVDSKWKFKFDLNLNRTLKIKELGHFMSAMDYASRTKGGMNAIGHIRHTPHDTWRAYSATTTYRRGF